MMCPKCAGLLIQEEIQEHSGRFHGWRCIQCGLRLDQTIAQNRHEARPDERSTSLSEDSQASAANPQARTSSRPKRPVGRT
jgi:DNA-directed RNA polymerase subunit M/transcription elongation factor TFIIS